MICSSYPNDNSLKSRRDMSQQQKSGDIIYVHRLQYYSKSDIFTDPCF
jgi:hypothetical protein